MTRSATAPNLLRTAKRCTMTPGELADGEAVSRPYGPAASAVSRRLWTSPASRRSFAAFPELDPPRQGVPDEPRRARQAHPAHACRRVAGDRSGGHHARRAVPEVRHAAGGHRADRAGDRL